MGFMSDDTSTAIARIKDLDAQFQLEAAEKLEREQRDKDNAAAELVTAPIRLDDIRNEINLMRYPFFSTDQKPRTEPIIYTNGKKVLEVRPATGLAMATQRDADLLRFAIKRIAKARDESGGWARGVNVTRRELLTQVFRGGDGAANYKELETKIKRLTTTTYTTNVFSVDPNEFYTGTLVNATYWKGDDGVERICLMLCEPLLKSIKRWNVKHLGLEFLDEKGNLRKKLLEVVAVHLGKEGKAWSVGLEQFAAQCAFTKGTWRFKEALKRARLPYKLSFHKDKAGGQVVTFTRQVPAA